MRVERLPFTVYDIVGYLVPGFIVIWCVSIFLNGDTGGGILNSTRFLLFGDSSYSYATTAFALLVIAYAVGHLIGFLSSITVEKLSIIYLDYPSRHLLEVYDFKGKNGRRTITANFLSHLSKARVWFVHLILLPVVPAIWVLNWFGWFSVLLKPLPADAVRAMEKNYRQLAGKEFSERDKEWFKYINFFVINKYENALSRMYNYITIYGFLRNFCLISCLFFWFYVYLFFCAACPKLCGQHVNFDQEARLVVACIVWAVIASIFFAAYVKFFRRYSEETLYAFATQFIKD